MFLLFVSFISSLKEYKQRYNIQSTGHPHTIKYKQSFFQLEVITFYLYSWHNCYTCNIYNLIPHRTLASNHGYSWNKMHSKEILFDPQVIFDICRTIPVVELSFTLSQRAYLSSFIQGHSNKIWTVSLTQFTDILILSTYTHLATIGLSFCFA